MIDVAAYRVFVCALFPMQGGMWTAVTNVCKRVQNTPISIFQNTLEWSRLE